MRLTASILAGSNRLSLLVSMFNQISLQNILLLHCCSTTECCSLTKKVRVQSLEAGLKYFQDFYTVSGCCSFGNGSLQLQSKLPAPDYQQVSPWRINLAPGLNFKGQIKKFQNFSNFLRIMPLEATSHTRNVKDYRPCLIFLMTYDGLAIDQNHFSFNKWCSS